MKAKTILKIIKERGILQEGLVIPTKNYTIKVKRDTVDTMTECSKCSLSELCSEIKLHCPMNDNCYLEIRDTYDNYIVV